MDRWRTEFLKAMKGLTTMYRVPCTEDLLALYEMVLSPLSVEQLVLAVRLWIEDPKHVFFPLPAQLKAMVIIQPNKEAEAALIVEKICYAQSTYGKDSVGLQRAKDKIGETGWELIEVKGGWERFWDEMQKGVDGTIKAQLRNALLGVMDTQRQTQVNRMTLGDFGVKMPELPET